MHREPVGSPSSGNTPPCSRGNSTTIAQRRPKSASLQTPRHTVPRFHRTRARGSQRLMNTNAESTRNVFARVDRTEESSVNVLSSIAAQNKVWSPTIEHDTIQCNVERCFVGAVGRTTAPLPLPNEHWHNRLGQETTNRRGAHFHSVLNLKTAGTTSIRPPLPTATHTNAPDTPMESNSCNERTMQFDLLVDAARPI